MSKNYIERIKTENGINIKIHKDGKVCTLTNPNSIKVLLNICHKQNKYFKNRNTIENVDSIIKEFDSYRANTKRKNEKLKIMPDNINKLVDKIRLIKKMPIPGKIIISSGLAATIGITSIGIVNSIPNRRDAIYTPHYYIEEEPEYIGDFENIEVSANDQYLDSNSDSLIINYDKGNFSEFELEEESAVEIENDDLNQMFQIEEFHFSYNDRTDSESLTNAKRYEDIFIKYGNQYGVDPTLLMAIASQESSGDHYNNLSGGCAIGIMQIEKSVWIGNSVSAYNFETGETDKINITLDNLKDLDTNIQVGTMILRNKIEEYNYNVPLAIQAYNFGSGNISKVINSCSESTGLPRGDIKDNYSIWMNYRDVVSVGDSKYVEHVFSYVAPDTVITVTDRDNNDRSLCIVNDNAKTIQMA